MYQELSCHVFGSLHVDVESVEEETAVRVRQLELSVASGYALRKAVGCGEGGYISLLLRLRMCRLL